jgi:MoxR-like ATPase
MLPADVIGTQIYNPQSGGFTTRKGPVFANLVLADEINRAPAKVQSALLEAMQERRSPSATRPSSWPEPFLVLATQNPIEQEGTYPLPEAQVDRFMLKLKIGYPTRAEERQILE